MWDRLVLALTILGDEEQRSQADLFDIETDICEKNSMTIRSLGKRSLLTEVAHDERELRQVLD